MPLSAALLAVLLVAGFPASIAAQSAASAFAQAPAPNGPREIPLRTFLADIDEWVERIEALGPTEAAAAVASVPDVWRVVAGGQRIDVDMRWLKSALADAPSHPESWKTQRDVLRKRLAHISEHAATFDDDPAAVVRARARAAAESILARDEFQQSAASRWRERMQERIGQWFEDLFARLDGARFAGRTTALAFAWAAAIAALAGLGFWLARTIAARPHGAALNLSSGPGSRPRARDLALRALAAARAGQAREAVRAAYHAAIVRLEEEGAWRMDEARTPREYLRMLRATDSRHPLMLDLTRRFERIWYGHRAAVPDDTASVAAHLETLGCLRPGERAI